VVVYTHKDPTVWLRQIAGERIHKVERIECWMFDRDLVDELVARLDRRMSIELSVTDGDLFLNVAGATLTGSLQRIPLG
jgi:uncharacterized protein YaeQ